MSDDRRLHLDARAVALLLACCALWGVAQVVIKVTLAEIPPFLQAAARSGGAALLLLAWMRWRGQGLRPERATWRGGLAAGVLFGAEFACIFSGLQFTNASRLAVFLYTAPFVVALGMPFIARSERLSAVQALGLAGAFAGVVWAFAEGFGAQAGPRQWLGDALGLTAAVLWGATTLVVRGSALGRASAEMALLYQLAVSALLLGVGAFVAGERWPVSVSATSWALLAFQAAVVSFASYLVWFWLVRHYPATQISVFTLLTPIFGLLAGVWLLGEPLTTRLVVALAAVCAGIWLVNARRSRGRGAAAPAQRDDPLSASGPSARA
ncbi:MAG: DMT family transporter [Rubrivivax sp.]|nr:DMT family transporter [Rubrivivax sp.]